MTKPQKDDLMDLRLLRSRISMYLTSQAGDPAARTLIDAAARWLSRVERLLYEREPHES